jgi:hypothetical protein
MSSLFEVLAKLDAEEQERREGNRAIVAAQTRAKERFAKFVGQAKNKEDLDARLALIDSNLRDLISDVVNEYGGDPDRVYLATTAVLGGGHASDCDCGFCQNKGKGFDSKDEDKEDKESSTHIACACGCNEEDCNCDANNACGHDGCKFVKSKESKLAMYHVAEVETTERLSSPQHGQYSQFTMQEVKQIAEAVNRVIQNPEDYPDGFEDPDYGDLDMSIAEKLSSDEVDALQYLVAEGRLVSTKEVSKALLTYGRIVYPYPGPYDPNRSSSIRRADVETTERLSSPQHGQYSQFTIQEVKQIAEAINRVIQNPEDYPDGFEYPDYGDLDMPIAEKLSSDEVDALQYLAQEFALEGRLVSTKEVSKALLTYGRIVYPYPGPYDPNRSSSIRRADVETGDSYQSETVSLPTADESGLGSEGSPKIDKGKSGDHTGWSLDPIDVKSERHRLEKQDVATKADYNNPDFDPSSPVRERQDATKATDPQNSGPTKSWTGTEGQAEPVTSKLRKWTVVNPNTGA